MSKQEVCSGIITEMSSLFQKLSVTWATDLQNKVKICSPLIQRLLQMFLLAILSEKLNELVRICMQHLWKRDSSNAKIRYLIQ